jgi:hypothetical protein
MRVVCALHATGEGQRGLTVRNYAAFRRIEAQGRCKNLILYVVRHQT